MEETMPAQELKKDESFVFRVAYVIAAPEDQPKEVDSCTLWGRFALLILPWLLCRFFYATFRVAYVVAWIAFVSLGVMAMAVFCWDAITVVIPSLFGKVVGAAADGLDFLFGWIYSQVGELLEPWGLGIIALLAILLLYPFLARFGREFWQSFLASDDGKLLADRFRGWKQSYCTVYKVV